MKGMNKKGFTLIELLAVIVVLAIVMVLAATTVLPYMTNAREEAFALEANTLKEAASQAVSLITIGTVTGYTDGDGDYCFELSELKNLGLFQKDDISKYAGRVVVTKNANSNSYTYAVSMKNDEFYVANVSTNVSADDIDAVANVGATVFTCAN